MEILLISIPSLIKCWIISSSFWFWSTRDRSQNGTSFSFVMLQTEFINFCISRNEIRFLDIGLWVYFFYRSDLFRRFSKTKFKFLPNANCAIARFRLYSEEIQKNQNFEKILDKITQNIQWLPEKKPKLNISAEWNWTWKSRFSENFQHKIPLHPESLENCIHWKCSEISLKIS